jgi:hypothetical protein
MSARNTLLGLIVAITGFVVVTVTVTELASSAIEFSLFLGLPAGLAGGVLLGALTFRWLGGESPASRRRGATLAAFGVVFLAMLVSLVVVGNLRNSQALPVAGVAGIVGGAGAYLWYRRYP